MAASLPAPHSSPSGLEEHVSGSGYGHAECPTCRRWRPPAEPAPGVTSRAQLPPPTPALMAGLVALGSLPAWQGIGPEQPFPAVPAPHPPSRFSQCLLTTECILQQKGQPQAPGHRVPRPCCQTGLSPPHPPHSKEGRVQARGPCDGRVHPQRPRAPPPPPQRAQL